VVALATCSAQTVGLRGGFVRRGSLTNMPNPYEQWKELAAKELKGADPDTLT